jgi:hypothetical protein
MIVVFNCDRIESLTANLCKFEDINFSEDTLVIYDCSKDVDAQIAVLSEYCQKHELKLGDQVLLKTRANWGLAEGGRIDLADDLRTSPAQHRFIFQFQDHYLDTTSEYSLWAQGKRDLNGVDISGKVKEDCIKSEFTISLSKYARYLENGDADVLYSSQAGIGLFPYWKDLFFCIDGVNFASRTETYLDIFDKSTCAGLTEIYDAGYEWALFAEHFVGYRMTQLNLKLCDTFFDVVFRDMPDIIAQSEGKGDLTELIHVSEMFYATLFYRYMQKMPLESE